MITHLIAAMGAMLALTIVLLLQINSVKLFFRNYFKEYLEDLESTTRQDSIYKHFQGDRFMLLDTISGSMVGDYILKRHYDNPADTTDWWLFKNKESNFDTPKFANKITTKGETKYINKRMLLDMIEPNDGVEYVKVVTKYN